MVSKRDTSHAGAGRTNVCRKEPENKPRQNTPSSVGYKARTFNNTSAYYINCFRARTSLISGHVFLTLKGECLSQGHLGGGLPRELVWVDNGDSYADNWWGFRNPPALR